MRLAMIFAMDQNGLVGSDGGLPWSLARDLRWFKAVTLGKTMIMGRRTWDSLGRALPGRVSIVVSRADRPEALDKAVHWVQSLDAAITLGRSIQSTSAELMLIGGPSLCDAAMPQVDRFYRTIVQACYAGDTYFERNFAEDWTISYEAHIPATNTTPSLLIQTLDHKV